MDDSRALRQQMVDTLRQRGALTDEAVARAFRTVPREVFVPGMPLDQVYQDEAIVTKEAGGVPVSSSSQPAIMAIMLEQLDVRPGMQVLEIGAGTGYNAALLQSLTGEHGRVITVDIDPEVATWARERLDGAGYPEVAVIRGDGADGYAPAAPYDRIELTVGTADIAPAWVDQLRPGGLLVLPLWINTAQVSLALEKRDGWLRSQSAEPCGFMRIRGSLAGRDRWVPIAPGVTAGAQREDLASDTLREILGQPPRRERWPAADVSGFGFFAALWNPLAVMLQSNDASLTGFTGGRFGYFEPGDPSLCLVPFALDGNVSEPEALAYGGDDARDRLRAAYDRWRQIGAPGITDLHVRVYPLSSAPAPIAGEVAVDTRWWRLIVARAGGPVR